MNDKTDNELMTLVKLHKDRKAMNEIIKHTEPGLMRYLMGICPDVAELLDSCVWVAIFRKRISLSQESKRQELVD